MPKEFVLARWEDPQFTSESRPTQGIVSVGWQNDMEHVQVATLRRDPITKETLSQGEYVDLDRAGINDLIRQLRKARDRSFGRDE